MTLFWKVAVLWGLIVSGILVSLYISRTNGLCNDHPSSPVQDSVRIMSCCATDMMLGGLTLDRYLRR